MKNISVGDIRKLFLDFFIKHGHKHFPSAPLITEDPTLLFTNAGMVRFKKAFVSGKSDVKTAVSSQKCVRAGGKHNDLENVGYTNRHHTFFEMLGNFSFGHYFKDVAIELAWNFVTKELGLNKNNLWITVYSEDQEATDIWKKVSGFPEHRIIKISTSDNFWSMGDTGPCGPCSEIFYDYGEHIEGGLPGTKDCDGARFTEIWNLVFMQFFKDEEGKMHPLPSKCIDTGMGLERISAVMQGVHDNYEIDMFKAIIEKSCSVFGNPNNPHAAIAHRVIADHVRAAAFLIAEGLVPGNEGRNYVLRRIIRRAVRYAYQLNNQKLSIHEVVPVLTTKGSAAYMGDVYPEIVRAEQSIVSVLKLEEEGFAQTLRKGLVLLEKEIGSLDAGKVLPGDIAFKLYDTYGFPVDITIDVAKERELTLDMQGFDKCMSEQKDRSRKQWVGFKSDSMSELWKHLSSQHKGTRFVGYTNSKTKATVLSVISNGQEVFHADEGDEVFVLLDVSPFYGESGGQEGDRGFLTKVSGNSNPDCQTIVEVLYTKKAADCLHVHECLVKKGRLKVGDIVEAAIDESRRKSLRANHSATHILHDVLRTLINSDVCQRGSLVAEEKLRFDFSYSSALTKEQILMIENEVNRRIVANDPVFIDHYTLKEAMQEGAIGLFEEKYSDHDVRVVKMGGSKEMCCGTHVRFTGDIGAFRIISESSVAVGVRRIEAITGSYVVNSIRKDESYLRQIAEQLGVPVCGIIDKVKGLQQEKLDLNKKLANTWRSMIKSEIHTTPLSDGITFHCGRSTDVSVEAIVDFVESTQERQNKIFVLSTINGDKAILVIGVGKTVSNKVSASDLTKALRALDAKGGGNHNIARVVINSSKIQEAESMIKDQVTKLLETHK